jgi:hypothetical protein
MNTYVCSRKTAPGVTNQAQLTAGFYWSVIHLSIINHSFVQSFVKVILQHLQGLSDRLPGVFQEAITA